MNTFSMLLSLFQIYEWDRIRFVRVKGWVNEEMKWRDQKINSCCQRAVTEVNSK
jgi:hypothetical protein